MYLFPNGAIFTLPTVQETIKPPCRKVQPPSGFVPFRLSTHSTKDTD